MVTLKVDGRFVFEYLPRSLTASKDAVFVVHGVRIVVCETGHSLSRLAIELGASLVRVEGKVEMFCKYKFKKQQISRCFGHILTNKIFGTVSLYLH